MTVRKRNHYMLLSTDGDYELYHDNGSLNSFLSTDKIEFGEVYRVGYKDYAAFTMKEILEYLDKAMRENSISYSMSVEVEDDYFTDFDTSYKPSKSMFDGLTQMKEPKKRRFDWDEEFLEGMRIFGNVEEAEGYADEQKKKC